MGTILDFAKNYFIFMLILFLFSYLTPREDYRKYFQFFIGALMAVILLRPVLEIFAGDGEEQLRARIGDMLAEVERADDFGEGEDIFEWFLRREGLDRKADEKP